MPGTAHEGPIELLRRKPLLVAALLPGTTAAAVGVLARLVAADLSTASPTELRADAVVVLEGPLLSRGLGRKLVVVVESQTRPDPAKRWVWPVYLAQARHEHRCPAVLVVICPGRSTGRWARRRIRTGHPGCHLVPLVIDASSTPASDDPRMQWAAPELAVLGALTGAVDLRGEDGRRLVLGAVATARLEEDELETYTHLIRAAAPAAARVALEAMMTTAFKDEFVERYKDEGRAEGKAEGRAEGEAKGRAEMVLRIMNARGIDVPDRLRERVLSCTDLSQLEAWGDAALTANSSQDVISD